MLLAGPGRLTDADLAGACRTTLGRATRAAALRARVGAAGLTAQLRRELDAQAARLEALAYTDELTKVHNRRYVGGSSTPRRPAQPATGARWRSCSSTSTASSRSTTSTATTPATASWPPSPSAWAPAAPGGRPGRWGGEEFLVLLPDTDAEGAVHAAEDLRARSAARRSAGTGARCGSP